MEGKEIIEKLEQINNMDEAYANHMIDYMHSVNEQAQNIFFSGAGRVNTESDFLTPYNGEINKMVCQCIFWVSADVFNNNLSKVIKSKEAVKADLNNWFSAEHTALGLASAGSWLKTILPDAFANPSESAEKVRAILQEKEMITGLIVLDQSDARHQLLHLIYALMVNLDPKVCAKLIEDWKKTALKARLEEMQNFRWLDIVKAEISPGSNLYSDFKDAIIEAIQKEVFVRTDNKSDVIDISPSGAPIVKQYLEDVYQQSVTVYNWMTSVGECRKYLTGAKPDFVERTVRRDAPPPSGCVLASTRLLMADGKYMPITEICPNSKVVNADGTESICSGEVIQNDHVKVLYSINEDEPCMSLEHLVLTASGYKCLDTGTALELNPRLQIAKLRVGDIVIKYENGKKVPVRVKKINCKAGNTELCADIHIADGLKSYITEQGYICYANYPEITGGSVLDAVSPWALDFRKFLKDNKQMLEQSFGRHAYSYISEISSACSSSVRMESSQADYAEIASMEHINYRIYSEEPLGFESMSIIRGHAFFGSSKEPVPLHIKDGEIYWKTGDTSGYAKVYHRGLVIKGHLIQDQKQKDFAATTSVLYDMSYQGAWDDAVYDSGKPEKFFDFGKFEMGYSQKVVGEEIRLVAEGKWIMPYMDENNKYVEGKVVSTEEGNGVAYTLDKNSGNLKATVSFPQGVAQLQFDMLRHSGCNKAELLFDLFFEGIEGTAFQTLEISGKEKETGKIRGTMAKEQAEQKKELVSALGDYLVKDRYPAVDISEDECRMLRSSYSPTVEDLLRVPVPTDMSQIQSQAFYRMLNMAVYAAYEGNDISAQVLGISKPIADDLTGDITVEQGKMAVEYSEFLIHQFISAYLSFVYIKKGLSPDCDEEFKRMVQPLLDIDDSLRRVRYYMNGNGKNCMGSKKEYSQITNSIYHSVYRNNLVYFDVFYLGDRQGWAKKLYERLSEEKTLVGLVNMQLVEPDNPRLQHYYTLLDILDSTTMISLVGNKDGGKEEKATYATVLRSRVMDGTLKSILNNVRLDTASAEFRQTFEELIVQYFQKFMKGISDGTFQNWDSNTEKEIKKELEEMAREYGYTSVEAMTADIMNVAADIVAEIMAMSDPHLSIRLYQYFKNHPKVSRILGIAFYGIGIAALLMGAMQIDKMSPAEKAEFSVAVADICIAGINDVSVLIALKCFKNGFGNLTQAENEILSSLSKSDFIEAMCNGSRTAREVLVEIGVNSLEEGTKASEFWLKVARLTTQIAKGVMILAVAVSIGVTGYQLYQDIIHGENPGIFILDSLNILASGVFIVTEAISCLAASVCAAIPIIGVVATAIGIVLAVISIFVKRKPPETPIEKIVNERLKGFVSAIDVPEDWKDPSPDTEEEELGLLAVMG